MPDMTTQELEDALNGELAGAGLDTMNEDALRTFINGVMDPYVDTYIRGGPKYIVVFHADESDDRKHWFEVKESAPEDDEIVVED